MINQHHDTKRFSRKTLIAGLLIAICLGLWCYDELSKPNWVRYYLAAHNAFEVNNLAEADKQAQLMLAEAQKDGGRMPPPMPQPWLAHLTLMQDRGEVFGYTGNLRRIGQSYEYASRTREAELCYRKALELDCAEYGPLSGKVCTWALPALICLLREHNRKDEVVALQEQLAYAKEAESIRRPFDNIVRSDALQAQAELAELKGKYAEAESDWKKRVELYSGELSDEKMQSDLKLKNTESNRRHGPLSLPSSVGPLQDLARFYRRQKNSSAELETLSQLEQLLHKVGDENSCYLTDARERADDLRNQLNADEENH